MIMYGETFYGCHTAHTSYSRVKETTRKDWINVKENIYRSLLQRAFMATYVEWLALNNGIQGALRLDPGWVTAMLDSVEGPVSKCFTMLHYWNVML